MRILFFRIIEVIFQYYITSYFVNLEWVWKDNIPITSPKQNICIFKIDISLKCLCTFFKLSATNGEKGNIFAVVITIL